MGLIIAFLICWTPVELIALIHFTGKAGMLCENACRTAKNVRNCYLKQGSISTWGLDHPHQGVNKSQMRVIINDSLNKNYNFENIKQSYIGMAIILYKFNTLSLYGWLQKTIERKYEQPKLARVSKSEAENRNSTIQMDQEPILSGLSMQSDLNVE